VKRHSAVPGPWAASGSARVCIGDNELVYIAKAFVQQPQFLSAIARVPLPPQVVSVLPTLGNDWGGEPAVFFKVIIADNAVPRPDLLAFTKGITQAIIQQIRPLEEWGYFRILIS